MTTIVSPDWPCVMNSLAAVEDPAVAVARRRRAHRGGIAAGPGLGQAPGRELLAARERRRGSAASAPRCRTWRCAPRRGRCARRPKATRSDRRAPAPRCRCSSRRPTCPSRRMRAGTECPSVRGRPASAAARAGNCCASSHSLTCGLISVSANSRTLRAQQLLIVGQTEVHLGNLSRWFEQSRRLPGSGEAISSARSLWKLPLLSCRKSSLMPEIEPAARSHADRALLAADEEEVGAVADPADQARRPGGWGSDGSGLFGESLLALGSVATIAAPAHVAARLEIHRLTGRARSMPVSFHASVEPTVDLIARAGPADDRRRRPGVIRSHRHRRRRRGRARCAATSSRSTRIVRRPPNPRCSSNSITPPRTGNEFALHPRAIAQHQHIGLQGQRRETQAQPPDGIVA